MKFDSSQVNWTALERLGITMKSLEETGDLERLLNGERTSLLHLKGSTTDLALDTYGKLCLVLENGKAKLVLHGKQHKLVIQDEMREYRFSKQEKEALMEHGRLNKPVLLLNSSGVKEKYYVGVDQELNKVVAVPESKLKEAEELKPGNIRLNDKQKSSLLSGQTFEISIPPQQKGGKQQAVSMRGVIDFARNTFRIEPVSFENERLSLAAEPDPRYNAKAKPENGPGNKEDTPSKPRQRKNRPS